MFQASGSDQECWNIRLLREVSGYTPDTRHTCGSRLPALDVHARAALQILRHNKIDTTMGIYAHVPSETTRRALEQLGARPADLVP